MRYALIAEPEESQASIYAAIAKDEGLTPVVVRDGAAAVAALYERGTPDLLITELALPQVSGLELIERLRRAPGGAKVPVVAMSASREMRDAATGRRVRLEIGAILSKATTDDSLRRVVKRLVGTAAAPADEKGAARNRRGAASAREAKPAPAGNGGESHAPPPPRESGVEIRDATEAAAVRAALRARR